MDDLFDFSFPGFEGFSDALSGLSSILGGVGLSFDEILPDLVEQAARFALARALGERLSGNPGRQLLNSFARSAFGGSSRGFQSGSYFQVSQGQSMAQLAAMINRAGQRFL